MFTYFKEYGPIHVSHSATITNPMHNPERDEPYDFSGLLRPLLDGQAHIVTATVKGLRVSKGGFNSAEMGCGKTFMAVAAAWKYLSGRGRVIVMCPDHIIDKWAEEIRISIPNATVVTFGKWTDVVRYYWNIMSDARSDKRWKEPHGIEFVVLGRDQSKYLPNCPNMGEEMSCFDGVRRSFGGSTQRCVGYEEAKDEYGSRIWDDKKQRWKRKPVVARIYRCPICGTPVFDRKKGIPVDVAKSASGLSCQGRVAVEVRKEDDSHHHSGRDRITLPASFQDFPVGKVVKLGSFWHPYKNGKCADPDKQYVIQPCGEPLWNYVRKPNRWAPAQFIHSKMRGAFDLCVIDEIHEEKSDSSAQAIAAGKIMASSRKILALTGTLIGGYAWHLFPTLMRINPSPLLSEGLKWGQSTEFSKRYGRVDRVVKITQEEDSGSSRSRRSTSMRRTRNGKQNEFFKIAPGVMPNLWAKQLMGCSVFLSMEDLADHMPPMVEYIGCDPATEDQVRDKKDPFWINTACDMEPMQSKETRRITEICKAVNDDLLRNNSMRFLAATLVTTMEYPDHPFDWTPEFVDEDDKAMPLLGQSFLGKFDHRFDPCTETLLLTRTLEDGSSETERLPLRKDCGVYYLDVVFNEKTTRELIYDTGASSVSLPKSMADDIGLVHESTDREGVAVIADGSEVPIRLTTIDSVRVGRFTLHDVEASVKSPKGEHAVGYWKVPKIRTRDNWVGVVTPKDLPKDVIYPKEKRLIEICKREKAAGNQTWVFVNMTGKRDVQPRLKDLLEKEGLRVGIMRARNVKPREREAWISKQGRDYDVMLSHPKPVMTGLDLLSKNAGGHNYNAIVFYQTGTHAFVCKQASRRAWRLIQKKKCRVYYLYYRATMQHHFVAFMAKKFAAMSAIAGDFNMDGLIAMGGGDDGSLALCKSLDNAIDDSVLQVNWAKAQGSYGVGDDDSSDSDNDAEVGGENLCPITDEDLRALASMEESISAASSAVEAGAEEEASPAASADISGQQEGASSDEDLLSKPLAESLDLDEEERILSEPLVEAVSLADDGDDEWFFSDEELELLNI